MPTLICSDYGARSQSMAFLAEMAEAVAHNLGVEDFLYNPERKDESRRTLWQKHPSL